MRKLRKIKGRKIKTSLQREKAEEKIQKAEEKKALIDKKRNKTRKINDQCLHCIYIQIQKDFNAQEDFSRNFSKKEALDIFKEWWLYPYENYIYSKSAGIASGINWALSHLISTGFITNIEYNELMPVIINNNEKHAKLIRHWNPKHSVGKRAWCEVLKFLDFFENMTEKEALKTVQRCKTLSLKQINKSLEKV